jgi:hypothetical protein
VVKPATIKTVLTLVCSHVRHVHQLDVKNVFLHGVLGELVHCYQLASFVDDMRRNHIYHLTKSLYGLKQAPWAWFQCFAITIGFAVSRSNAALFILWQGSDTAYLLLYVDDIVLSASSLAFLSTIIDQLQQEFAMIDMGTLHYFISIHVHRIPPGFFLDQT